MIASQQADLQPETTTVQRVVARHSPLCVIWFILMATGFGLSLVLTGPALLLSALLGAYAAQGFVAEILGVRIDAAAISAPRRFMSVAPLLVLWRERIPLTAVERITSKRPLFGVDWATIHKGYGDRASIVFSSRDQKIYFFKSIKAFQPTLELYRSN